MSQDIVIGKIMEITPEGLAHIVAPVPNLDRALDRDYRQVEVGFCDGRTISPIQRRKIYALNREIASWIGDDEVSNIKTMKMDFILNRQQCMTRQMFSLSSVDMNTAADFITYLIDFILEHDIPCNDSKLQDNCEDIGKYVYSCLMNKRCACCGKAADLHHVDAVGLGNDRQEVHHLGREALPLCREHHTEAHQIGNNLFMDKYHLQPVKIDEAICKKHKLKK